MSIDWSVCTTSPQTQPQHARGSHARNHLERPTTDGNALQCDYESLLQSKATVLCLPRCRCPSRQLHTKSKHATGISKPPLNETLQRRRKLNNQSRGQSACVVCPFPSCNARPSMPSIVATFPTARFKCSPYVFSLKECTVPSPAYSSHCCSVQRAATCVVLPSPRVRPGLYQRRPRPAAERSAVSPRHSPPGSGSR